MQKHINIYFMLKDFYKLNKQKVILAIIIMVIHVPIAFYSAFTAFCAVPICPDPNIIQIITEPTVFPFVIIMLVGEFFEGIHFLPELLMITFTIIISLFVLSIFWYTLSCGIVKIKSKYFSK